MVLYGKLCAENFIANQSSFIEESDTLNKKLNNGIDFYSILAMEIIWVKIFIFKL